MLSKKGKKYHLIIPSSVKNCQLADKVQLYKFFLVCTDDSKVKDNSCWCKDLEKTQQLISQKNISNFVKPADIFPEDDRDKKLPNQVKDRDEDESDNYYGLSGLSTCWQDKNTPSLTPSLSYNLKLCTTKVSHVCSLRFCWRVCITRGRGSKLSVGDVWYVRGDFLFLRGVLTSK